MKILNNLVILSVFFSTAWCAPRIAIEKRIVRQKRQLVATLCDGHEIVGRVDFRVECADECKRGLILNLCVNEDCRGQGVGTQLLCGALRTMVAEGCAYAQLVALPLENRGVPDLLARTADLVRFYGCFGAKVDSAIFAVPGVGMQFDLLDAEVCALHAEEVQPKTPWRVRECLAKRETYYDLCCFLETTKDSEPAEEPCVRRKADCVCTFLIKSSDAEGLSAIEQCKFYREVDAETALHIAKDVACIVRCFPDDVAIVLRISKLPALRASDCAHMMPRPLSPCAGGRVRGEGKADGE